MACSCLWEGSMAGADGEDTFMKDSADTDVAQLRYVNFRNGEMLIQTAVPVSLSTSSIPRTSARIPLYSLPQ